jgi:ABC-type bacteriocin/lantibiotic exporter with double-glycine peptidase domain
MSETPLPGIFSDRARRRDGRIVGRTPFLRSWRLRRVPYIPQTTFVDCGAACLAMVLATYGRKVPLRGLQEEFRASRDALSLDDIRRVAEQQGLRARGLSMEAEDLGQLQTPAILHWDFTHFVVLVRRTRRGAVIIDPGSGRMFIRQERLISSFTGIALELTPRSDFERIAATESLSVLKLLRGVRARVAAALGLSALLQTLALAVPAITAVVIDRIIPARNVASLPYLYGAVLLVAIVYVSTAVARSRLNIGLQLAFEQETTRVILAKLLRLPMSYFQVRSTADLLDRVTSVAQIRDLLGQEVVRIVLEGLTALAYLTGLAFLAPRLFGVAVIFAVGQIVWLLLTKTRLQDAILDHVSAHTRTFAWFLNVVREIQSVKTAGAEENVESAFGELYAAELRTALERLRLSMRSDIVTSASLALMPAALLALGTHDVLLHSISLGRMMAYNTAALGFIVPWTSLLSSAPRLYLVRRHIARIDDVLCQEMESTGVAPPPARLDPGIEMRNVTFAYGNSRPVLRDVSLTIREGEIVALVGLSGAGKSTIGKLLFGLYPAKGIYVNDQEISNYDLPALRRRFGVVTQESAIFAGTLRMNISFYKPDLSVEEIEEAARLACIHDDFAALPLGYETRLSEAGGNFSGGQRQRICLARALAHHPMFLVLDEATSEIDALTESRIYENVRRMGVATLVIAHRLSTIRDADQIFVVVGGTVAERGTHAALMAMRGHYYRMVMTQEGGE